MTTQMAEQPGAVVRHLVESGAEVSTGTGVLVVETMKFESTIGSPVAGVVSAIAPLGQVVEVGTPLFTVTS